MRTAFAALAALVLLVGCQGILGERLVDDPAEPTYPDDTDAVSIEYRNGLCDGNCPSFSVEICGNGTVFYTGFANVNATGLHRYSVPQSNATAVLNASYRADFFELNESYPAQADGVSSRWTRVSIGNNSHSIRDYGSSWGTSPERLGEFQATLLERAAVDPLIRGDSRDVDDERYDELEGRKPFCA
ncbi:DUF6438 domain-containing protein [Halosimplex amylolyticum]|uniref:DUF6438 domain-containing protein n=1 Tax=Halosimplex amylolyticum TaxID=3396616 RepID=UPI003F54B9F6